MRHVDFNQLPALYVINLWVYNPTNADITFLNRIYQPSIDDLIWKSENDRDLPGVCKSQEMKEESNFTIK